MARSKSIRRNATSEHTMHAPARSRPQGQQNIAFHPALIAAVARPELTKSAELETSEPVPVSWPEMVSHRTDLIRFAQRKLHDPMLAEDVVHDVFEAVISGRAKFGGRCALKSWLTAILKFKIVDLVRQRVGYDSLDAGSDEDGEAPETPVLSCPQPQPDEVAEQRERLLHILSRIQDLPDSLRSVIDLRVLQDRSTEDVCRTLAISEDNLFVRLHRARKQLAS